MMMAESQEKFAAKSGRAHSFRFFCKPQSWPLEFSAQDENTSEIFSDVTSRNVLKKPLSASEIYCTEKKNRKVVRLGMLSAQSRQKVLGRGRKENVFWESILPVGFSGRVSGFLCLCSSFL